MNSLLHKIVSNHLPAEHVKFAVGYGSGVFKQANYSAPNLVIDMLLFVDDSHKFHERNIQMNRNHYSGLAKILPIDCTTVMTNSGAGLYFCPLIKLSTFDSFPGDQRQIKYGIMTVENAVRDLQEWEYFSLAGRLQKPVLPFIPSENDEFELAMQQNTLNAAYTAILMHSGKVDPISMDQFLETICKFSYEGDIRMRWKMENPNKVKNLVQGNKQELSKIYLPILMDMQVEGLVTIHNDGKFSVRNSTSNLQKVFDQVPETLKVGMKRSVIQLSLQEIQEDVSANLAKKVGLTSKLMLLSGVYSTSPVKGFTYLLSKFKKGRQ